MNLTLSSHKRGKWRTISKGSASAAKTINSDNPLLRVLVASFAPFLIFLKLTAWLMTSRMVFWRGLGARGKALDLLVSFPFSSVTAASFWTVLSFFFILRFILPFKFINNFLEKTT
jgi:hypothetical protein